LYEYRHDPPPRDRLNQLILTLTSETTEILIEGIERASRELADTDSSATAIEDEQIRAHAFNRMRKTLNLAVAVIKTVAADVYAQWHPSPNLPEAGDGFDPTEDAKLEEYMEEVKDFLNRLISERDSTNNPDKEGTVHKLGKGIKKIALHLAPFVTLLINIGKHDGVVSLNVERNSWLRSLFPMESFAAD
jgi:hypothetical protein